MRVSFPLRSGFERRTSIPGFLEPAARKPIFGLSVFSTHGRRLGLSERIHRIFR